MNPVLKWTVIAALALSLPVTAAACSSASSAGTDAAGALTQPIDRANGAAAAAAQNQAQQDQAARQLGPGR